MHHAPHWYNQNVECRISALFLVFIFAIASCGIVSGNNDNAQATPTILYYHTPTSTLKASQPTLEVKSTDRPQPTVTPFVYKVVANDTMLGIASRFGVTLEDLLAVNPGVDPNFLIVGTDLIIPAEGTQGFASLPVTAPIVLKEVELLCYSTAAGGLWCFWLVENDQDKGVEDLSATITLYNSKGDEIASQEAVGPLNVLWPGERFPLVAFFDPPALDWLQARAWLLTSLPVSLDNDRYLKTEINQLAFTVLAQGLAANVSGEIRLLDAGKEAGLVWVLAVAYDQDGHVVGVRRWENEQGIKEGKKRAFDMNVYSMGPVITDVQVFVEAQP